jgi:two-component sensor histidine kinase
VAGQIIVNLALTQTPDSGESQISVEFRDNGPGFPEDVLLLQQRNVGLYLIQKIVQQDLKGKVIWHNDPGAVTTIYFPVETIENEESG